MRFIATSAAHREMFGPDETPTSSQAKSDAMLKMSRRNIQSIDSLRCNETLTDECFPPSPSASTFFFAQGISAYPITASDFRDWHGGDCTWCVSIRTIETCHNNTFFQRASILMMDNCDWLITAGPESPPNELMFHMGHLPTR
nr:hypothetical protein CFP56_21222 [Quercus suber]